LHLIWFKQFTYYQHWLVMPSIISGRPGCPSRAR
jgi:hypothetical protein